MWKKWFDKVDFYWSGSQTVTTGNCVEPYKVALKHAALVDIIMDNQPDKQSTSDRNCNQHKHPTLERTSSKTKDPPPNPGVASIRGIVSMEPQSSRGAAYMRNTTRLVKKDSHEEKRDYGKGEKFKLKRRCNSIIIEDDDDIRNLEVTHLHSCCLLSTFKHCEYYCTVSTTQNTLKKMTPRA
mgnify:CR=1 FL=1